MTPTDVIELPVASRLLPDRRLPISRLHFVDRSVPGAAVKNANSGLSTWPSWIDVPIVFTEQDRERVFGGRWMIWISAGRIMHKRTFDAFREPDFLELFPAHRHIVVWRRSRPIVRAADRSRFAGPGRKVFRRTGPLGYLVTGEQVDRNSPLESMAPNTSPTEMVVCEWLESA